MKYIFCLLSVFITSVIAAQDYTEYQSLLSLCVNTEGKVDYKKLVQQKDKLNQVTASLANFNINNISNRKETLAYWINVYNAFTLKLIVDHYPIHSIMDIENGKTWDVKRIKIGRLTYSLNQIENEIIRPEYKDARIHFALNCGAASCPPLLNKVYTGSTVDALLDQQTLTFITKELKSYDGNKINISKIFDWYKNDFENIIDFLSRFSNTKLPQNTRIEYNDYDWKLNER